MSSSKTDLKKEHDPENRNSENLTLKSNSFFDSPEHCDLKILLRFCCNIVLNFSL